MKKDIHIITPAKVASRTLYDYISKEKNSTIVENVYHNHYLPNLKNIVNSQKNKIIIVGVRNPIERKISYILKNHTLQYCSKSCPRHPLRGVCTKKNNYKGDYSCYIPPNVSDNEFIEAYFKVDIHNTFIDWLEEFIEIINIDNFNFDKNKGVDFYNLSNGNKLIIYTKEKLNNNFNTILKYLDITFDNKIENKNVNNTERYKNIKNKITYTHDYVNMLLNNDVIKLFYTDQDIEMFRKVNYKNE